MTLMVYILALYACLCLLSLYDHIGNKNEHKKGANAYIVELTNKGMNLVDESRV